MQLVSVYHKLVAESGPSDDDALFSAGYHITKPIIKLVDACHELPGTMAQLEAVLLPMVEDMCSRSPEDVIEPVRPACRPE